jgi:site-specific recombinase XerD
MNFDHFIPARQNIAIPVSDIDQAVIWINKEAPELEELTPGQLRAVARLVLMNRLAKDLDQRAAVAAINYSAEKTVFLDNAGGVKSRHTRKAYTSALKALESFTAKTGMAVLELTPKQADDFIYSLSSSGRAPASVRRDAAACSAFFTFLERRHDTIQNPFRGTRARPKNELKRRVLYPTENEAALVLERLKPDTGAVLQIVLSRGLRAGAFPGLQIWGTRFTARSKGKDIAGDFPPELTQLIKDAGLDTRAPFAGHTANAISERIKSVTKKLYRERKIADAFSIHDFRHLFAVTEYRKNRDIYRLSKLLHHSGIQMTERYLRGLGEID